jgi:AcrR family transcriptional regulator
MATDITTGGRARRSARTRESLQREALRLFLSKGFEATTVEEIAAAAGVSHMTFFRHFPSKEAVVLDDEYDPLIEELIVRRPIDEAPLEKIRRALSSGLQQIYASHRDALFARTRLVYQTPQLRAQLWEQQTATQRLIAEALARSERRRAVTMRHRVLAGAALAAMTTAIETWVSGESRRELPKLIEEAFRTLAAEVGHG